MYLQEYDKVYRNYGEATEDKTTPNSTLSLLLCLPPPTHLCTQDQELLLAKCLAAIARKTHVTVSLGLSRVEQLFDLICWFLCVVCQRGMSLSGRGLALP